MNRLCFYEDSSCLYFYGGALFGPIVNFMASPNKTGGTVFLSRLLYSFMLSFDTNTSEDVKRSPNKNCSLHFVL